MAPDLFCPVLGKFQAPGYLGILHGGTMFSQVTSVNSTHTGNTAQSNSWFKPTYLGIALLLSWIFLLFYKQVDTPITVMHITASVSDFVFWGSSAMLSCTLLAFCAKTSAAINLSLRKSLRILAPLSICLGTAITFWFLSSAANHQPKDTASIAELAALISGSVLTGTGSAILACRWAHAFERLRAGVIILHSAAIISVATAISITTGYLPEQLIAVTAIALPLASTYCLEKCEGQQARCNEKHSQLQEDSLSGRLTRWCTPLLYLCTFTLGFAPTFLQSSAGPYGTICSQLLCLASTVIVLLVCLIYDLLFHRKAIVLSIVAPIALLTVVLIPSMSFPGSNPLSAFLSSGYLCLEALLFVMFVVTGKQTHRPVAQTYAIGRLTYVLADVLGYICGNCAIHLDEGTLNALAGTFMGVGCCVVLAFAGFLIVLSSMRFVTVYLGEESERPNPGPISDSAPVLGQTPLDDNTVSRTGNDMDHTAKTVGTAEATKIELFSDHYSLTEREKDVLAELVKGHTLSRIQEVLHISKGTTSYHVQNIYAKCNVHSKQELIDLFDQ